MSRAQRDTLGMLLCWPWYKIQYSAPKYVFQVCSAVAQPICQYERIEKHIERWIIRPRPQWMSGRCQKLKEYGQTPNVSMSLYLPQIVTSRSYGVMVLDRCTTLLSPLSHLILMEWCVYKHQEWYPLNSERILHFSQCLQSVVGLLCCGLCLHHSSSLQHRRKNVFGSWVSQLEFKRVWIAGLRGGWL